MLRFLAPLLFAFRPLALPCGLALSALLGPQPFPFLRHALFLCGGLGPLAGHLLGHLPLALAFLLGLFLGPALAVGLRGFAAGRLRLGQTLALGFLFLEPRVFWRGLATIDGKADALGRYEVFLGDYELLFQAPAQTESVSVDDIRQAAAIFNTQNMTVGVLRQQPDEEAKAEE